MPVYPVLKGKTLVSMPAIFNNCLLNAYSAYLLSNALPLPADLFTPDENNPNKMVEDLKKTFKNEADLELFTAYYQTRFPHSAPSSGTAEKTLILGILFRDWFSKKLLADQDNKEKMLTGVIGNGIPNFIQIMKSTVENGPILVEELLMYQSNKVFIEQFLSNLTDTEKTSRTMSPSSQEKCMAYWNKEGYKHYCMHLAQPGTTVATTDYNAVFKEQRVPFVVHDIRQLKTQGLPNSEQANKTPPPNQKPSFEVALNTNEGHFHLLSTTPSSTKWLNDYETLWTQYTKDRATILDMNVPTNAIFLACNKTQSALVALTLPNDLLPNNKTEALEITLKHLHKIVAAEQKKAAPSKKRGRNDNPMDELEELITDPTKRDGLGLIRLSELTETLKTLKKTCVDKITNTNPHEETMLKDLLNKNDAMNQLISKGQSIMNEPFSKYTMAIFAFSKEAEELNLLPPTNEQWIVKMLALIERAQNIQLAAMNLSNSHPEKSAYIDQTNKISTALRSALDYILMAQENHPSSNATASTNLVNGCALLKKTLQELKNGSVSREEDRNNNRPISPIQ